MDCDERRLKEELYSNWERRKGVRRREFKTNFRNNMREET